MVFSSSRSYRRALLLTIGLAALSPPAAADVITLNPTADARILKLFPTDPQGTNAQLSTFNNGGTNEQRTLLLFDLSAIPTGATINSATLTLFGNSFFGATRTDPQFLFRVTEAWSESQATWNERLTGIPWSNAGGDFVGTTGVYNASPYATNTALADITVRQYDWAVANLVAEWLGGISPNHGFLLRADATELHFISREGIGPPGNNLPGDGKPTLTIDFTSGVAAAAPEPGTLGLALLGLSIFFLRRYRV